MNKLSFIKLWNDETDLIEVKIKASNGFFSGEIDIYTYIDSFIAFAEQLILYNGDKSINPSIQFGGNEKDSINFTLIKVQPFNITGLSSFFFEIDNKKKEIEFGKASFHLECYPATINLIGERIINWTKDTQNPFSYEWKSN